MARQENEGVGLLSSRSASFSTIDDEKKRMYDYGSRGRSTGERGRLESGGRGRKTGMGREATVKTKDGRTLAWKEFGATADDMDSVPIVLCAPLGGVSVFGHWFSVAAERHKARMIVPDRPGCGRSSPYSKRTNIAGMLDFHADELAELLDFLQIPSCAVLGVSAGAMFAARFVQRYPSRAISLCLVTPWNPLTVCPRGFQWWCYLGRCLSCLMPCAAWWQRKRMQQIVDYRGDFRDAFGVTSFDDDVEDTSNTDQSRDNISSCALVPLCVRAISTCCNFVSRAFSRCCSCPGSKITERELRALRRPASQALLCATFREIFRQDSDAFNRELKLCVGANWTCTGDAFRYESVKNASTCFLGSRDLMTPLAVGEAIATSMPDCATELVEDASHQMFVVKEISDRIVRRAVLDFRIERGLREDEPVGPTREIVN